MQSNGISPPAPRPPPPTTPHCSPYFPGPYARSLLCAGPAKPNFPSLDPRPLSLRPSGTLEYLDPGSDTGRLATTSASKGPFRRGSLARMQQVLWHSFGEFSFVTQY